MKKSSKIYITISSLLSGLILSRFAISKLTGWEISVKAFIEMAKPLGIDPTFFRIFTGVLILVVFISYLITAIYTFFQDKEFLSHRINYYVFGIFAHTLGLLTMVGALIAEFALRVEPKWLLVFIALGIVISSAINLMIFNKKLKTLNLT
ncbi:hypothetical protein V9L05_18650 [Bernardetia sp. Wsw4-3y2]|uniref:hypothetical protein n=1 Tax=Bernardetia sp. Wsw4-3y2 TaxID=3127471 RepID=UPI0030CC2FB4